MDSEARDKYFYLITVHTGFRRGSGTKSNVCFVLSGEENDTGVRLLTDGITEVFCIFKMLFIVMIVIQVMKFPVK